MKKKTEKPGGRRASAKDAESQAEEHIEKLLARLPDWMARGVRRIRRPSARWIRIPVALLLTIGAFLSFLPVLGLWMLPLAIILLAEDIPLLRHWVDRFVNWLALRKPQWFR